MPHMSKTTMSTRCHHKRRVMAALLTVAAAVLVQTASASVITNNARGVEQYPQQPRDLFENADVVPMAKRESASESAEHASWISKALVLAGTYSPTVSTIAGKATTTSTVKTTSTTVKTSSTVVKTTVKTTSTTVKTISTTVKASSTSAKTTSTTPKTTSTTPKTTSTTPKTTSTTPKTTSTTSLKATASAKPAVTTAKVTSTSSIKTTGNLPTAGATSAKTTAKTTSTTAKPKTQTWSWAAAAYGCGTAKPSGKALLCYATGTARANKRSPEATAAPPFEREDDEALELVKRVADATTMPDLGWLDTIVGAVPYRSGDLASSIVWIVLTLLLTPLFVVRLLRRSSLVAHVLICIFCWACAMVASFGIRAWMAASTPTTRFIIAENVILQTLPCLLLEPLFSLLAMYSAQGEVKSGVPFVCMLLRVINLAVLALFAVTAAFTGIFLKQWDHALMSSTDSGARNAFPADLPASITQLGPIIASFLMLAVIAGGLLLIPVARGVNGSMRPGAFLAALFTLVGISVTYRILQTLHAREALANEAYADSASDVVSTTLLQLASSSMVKIADITPPGMFSSGVRGIAWNKLQSSMASRSYPQSPLIFNLVYVFPMWLQVFLLFFVHAPAGDHSIKAKVAALEASA